MARTAQLAARPILGCTKCSCGVHEGCTPEPKGRTASGAWLPHYHKEGSHEPDCVCYKALLAKKKKKEQDRKNRIAEAKRKEDERESMAARLSAVENILWGKSFENSKSKRRPRAIVDQEEARAAITTLDSIKSASSVKRRKK